MIMLVICQSSSAASSKLICILPGAFGTLFAKNDQDLGRDNARKPLYELYKICLSQGCRLKQIDYKSVIVGDYLVSFDVPYQLPPCFYKYPKECRILFLWEPPTVAPQNYESRYHALFGKIYTWCDDLVDNKRYFKFYYPQPSLIMDERVSSFEEKKLCAIIISAKRSSHPNELYSERFHVVEYFQRYHPDDLDFYGMGWQPGCSPLYKGTVKSKRECLTGYKFVFCYENIQNINGYVTEKIFDAFVAGCVPIYLGASNIQEYVPKACFIDRRDFKSLDDLYTYLKTMSAEEYGARIDAIRRYLSSEQAYCFSIDYFIQTMMYALSIHY